MFKLIRFKNSSGNNQFERSFIRAFHVKIHISTRQILDTLFLEILKVSSFNRVLLVTESR